MNKKTYPYISVTDHQNAWEFSMIVKPGKSVYLQGISKEQLVVNRNKTAANKFLDRIARIGTRFESRSRAEAGRLFYQDAFGRNAVAKSRLA